MNRNLKLNHTDTPSPNMIKKSNSKSISRDKPQPSSLIKKGTTIMTPTVIKESTTAANKSNSKVNIISPGIKPVKQT